MRDKICETTDAIDKQLTSTKRRVKFALAFLTLVVITLIALTGCTPVPVQPEVVVVTKVTTPSDSMITNCTVEPPPDTKQYLAANSDDKERMLFEHATIQYKNLFDCNIKLGELRKWKSKVEGK